MNDLLNDEAREQGPDVRPRGGAPTEIETSPFGAGVRGPRRRALWIGGFALVLLVTLVIVYLVTRRGDASGSSSGHNHGAVAGTDQAQPVMLSFTEAERIGVTYAPVSFGALATEVRTVAQVTYDETRVKTIAPKIDGWVDQLYVNYTGQPVERGQPLLAIYSPMVVSAQQELLLADKLAKDVAGGNADARGGASDLRDAARRRLLYWDIPSEAVDRLERTGQVEKNVVLRSPVSGVVVEKNVLGGQKIMAGDAVYKVADLSVVWLEGEVFERDLPSVRVGEMVVTEFQALPGVRRGGRITYIYPTIDPNTRTARVRVELPNPALQLKPGMYATIIVSGRAGGPTLSVPRSAVLATGTRNLVFVKRRDGMLEPRDVEIGVATEDRVQILSGVTQSDTVVASATFLVDAESNLGSALGGMGNMPGMDMTAPASEQPKSGAPRPAPAAPPAATQNTAPKTAPDMDDMPGMSHSGHQE